MQVQPHLFQSDYLPEPTPINHHHRFSTAEEMVNKLTEDPWEQEKLPRIWKYYCERTERAHGYTPSELRIKKGLSRLRELVRWANGDRGNALKAFKLAIDNLAEDEFLSGKNDRHREYRDWHDHLCKSWECFEKRLLAK